MKYEQEAYEDLLRNSPNAESFVDTPEGRGTVVEVDLLRQRVKVRMEDAPETISVFANADIAVLRNGKAKKNDPPIPADLAPISGSGKRVRKQTQEEEPVLLEPIRFRYSTEKVVDEPEVPDEQPETAEDVKEPKEGKSRSRRRRKGKGEGAKAEQPAPEQPKNEQPKKEQPKKEQPKKEEPSAEVSENGEEAAKKPRRRNNYRRHRKPKTAGENQNG